MPARRIVGPLFACALLWSPCSPAIDRIDPRDFDPKADPCHSLYQFANGGWLANTPIPLGLERNDWLREQAKTVDSQRGLLLESLTLEDSDPMASTLAHLVASISDEARLPAARQQALAALLPALAQIERPAHVRELLTVYQQRGLPILFFPSRGDDRSVNIDTDVLTLPDPAFYLEPSAQAQIWRSRLTQYISDLLRASGSADVDTETAWAIDFEMQVAEAMRQPAPAQLDLGGLNRSAPGIEWKPLLKALDLDRAKIYRVSDLSPYARIDSLIDEAHPVQWKAWLRYRIAHLLAPYFDQPFREPHDRFIRGQLLDQTLPISPAQRRRDLSERLLGPAVDQLYAARYASEPRRQAIRELWQALSATLNKAIERHPDWSPATRDNARAKLNALQLEIGPGLAPTGLERLKLAADNLPGNALALLRWRQQVAVSARGPWLHYWHPRNQMQIATEALQPPLFDPDSEAALRFGSIGVLLAHELMHGFDLGGASFDAKGRDQAWWSEAERASYALRLAALDDAQDLPAALADASRHERAADLAALRLAYAAFETATAGKAGERQHGLSPAQRFFVAFASQLRENSLPAAAAPAWPQQQQQRLQMAVPLLAEFRAAFQCKTASTTLDPAFWP